MADQPTVDLPHELGELRRLIAELTDRVSRLEAAPRSGRKDPSPGRAKRRTDHAPRAGDDAIPAEHLIAISAAIATYLGAHAHVRQIRLITSPSWAQQGRVSVQASHRLER